MSRVGGSGRFLDGWSNPATRIVGVIRLNFCCLLTSRSEIFAASCGAAIQPAVLADFRRVYAVLTMSYINLAVVWFAGFAIVPTALALNRDWRLEYTDPPASWLWVLIGGYLPVRGVVSILPPEYLDR